MKISHKKQSGIRELMLLVILVISFKSKAQLNPMVVTYYQNQYLINPAMAGLDSGLRLNFAYKQQWSSVPGAPKTESISGDVGVNSKAGLGINIHSDETGLLKRLRALGSYSYHLPINGEDQKLSFGISLGIMNEMIGFEKVKGDNGDQSVGRFNERELFVDADFGTAFTSRNLTIQAAFPNMKRFLKKDGTTNVIERSSFFTAASYKFYAPKYLNGLGVEPKVCYRRMEVYHVFDIGANVTFAENKVNLMTIYHTSKNLSYGMGIFYDKTISVLGIYTTETSALSRYTNGTFEVAVRLHMF